MRKLFILILLIITTRLVSQNINNWDTAWVSSFGGLNIDIGRDVKETQDKGFIIAGTSSTYGSGNSSFYIIKTDSLGGYKWSKSIGSQDNDYCYSVEVSFDGGYFFSGTSNNNSQSDYDGVLIKTDSLGEVLWSKSYGGSDWDFIYNSCIMPDGGLILCGESYSESKGGSDLYLIRVKANGDTLWTKKFGSTGDDALYSVRQKNNRIYAAGKVFNSTNNKNLACLVKLDFNGNILKDDFFTNDSTEDYIYKDLSITNKDEILLCGRRGDGDLGHPILIRKDTTSLNNQGYITDSQSFHHKCVIEGYSREIYALGYSFGGLGGRGASFIRYDSTLNYMLGANFGGVEDEEVFVMVKTTRGFAFIGSTKSYGNQNGSTDENVYLVVFNKKNLVSDYYVQLTEFQDNLSMVGISSTKNIVFPEALVYPNPTESDFIIRFKDNSLKGKIIKYELYDVSGKLVDEEVIIIDDNHVKLKRKMYPSNIYFYRLTLDSNIISTGKISFE